MPAPKFDKFKKYFHRRSSIQEIVREQTSGGIIFRHRDGKVQILLAQDMKDRWTIPKGHIEEGETAVQTARREIGEETGLMNVDMLGWLGKVDFRYRRIDKLVLMEMQVYLVRVVGDSDSLRRDEWMHDLQWLDAMDALDHIEYEDIGKLILLAMKRIRQEKL